MKTSLLFVAVITMSCFVQAQSWKKHYRAPGDIDSYSHTEVQGGYAILTIGDFNPSTSIYKVNESGNFVWHIYSAAKYAKMIASGDGGIVFAGAYDTSYTTADSSYLEIQKITSDAATEWKTLFKDSSGVIEPIRIVRSDDGNFHVAAKSVDYSGGSPVTSYLIIKVGSAGNILGHTRFGQYTIYDLAARSNSEVLFIAREAGTIKMVNLDVSGTVVSSQSLNINLSVYNGEIGTQQTIDGGFIINARFGSPLNSTPLIIKTNSQGSILWTDTFYTQSIAEHNDGTLYATYSARDSIILTDTIYYREIGLRKMTSSGADIWTSTFPLSFPYESETDAQIQVLADGNFLLLGQSSLYSNNLFLIKTDSSGFIPAIHSIEELFVFDSLSVNNISTTFTPDGSFFWDYDNATFEVPRDSGIHTIFGGGLWIGGIDAGGQLHMAAQTYRQTGKDYWPGPLDSSGNTNLQTVSDWEKIWKVTQAQVLQHVADFNDNGVIDFPIDAVFDWPAKGNAFAIGNIGIPLVINQEAAPFFDMNGDGLYDPTLGDYPDIKGDEMLWYVFNDKGGIHTESGGQPIGAEIQISAYGYNCPSDTTLYNTLFIDYKIINKSSLQIYDVYIGKWIDFDIGCFLNDYVGCDTLSNTFYAYNGTTTDFDCATAGYGNNPPVQTVTFLNQDMSAFAYYNNDQSVTGNPQTAVQYYNYMDGLWTDNTPYTNGSCNGYGTGTPTKFMFLGNPSDTLPSWSECSCNNTPADRRGLGAIGPFTFNPGQVIDMSLAFSTHFLPFNGCPDFTVYRERIDSIQYKFNNNLLQACMEVSFTCDDTVNTCVWPGDADDNGIANIQDVLPIGIAYNDTFATRPNASTNWIGQPMQDWTQNFSLIGTNYKHADCNGDGVIDSFDFQPILDNYELVHFKGSASQKTGIPLYLEVQPGAFTAGSTVSVDVFLGTQTMQIPDFYAIAFSVLYNGAVVLPGSVTIDLNNSWAGTKSVDLMGIHKEFSAQGRVDIGVTRIDKANRAGFGRIARINYILIDDIAGKDAMELATLSPWVIEAKAIRNDETEIELFLSVEDDKVQEKISLYPNPAEAILFVEIPAALQAEFVRVYDSIGKEIMRINQPAQKISISTENFPEGIYFIEVRSREGKTVTKFVIAK